MPEHTIAENLARLQAARTAIGAAITAKGGTVGSGDGFEEFPADIAAIPSGGGATRSNVNFYDYDGTIMKSYTKQEFLALESMPANPTHEGLTAQGWNWSLSDAKTYVTANDSLDIGQMYITSDGKTRIYVRMEDGRLNPELNLTFAEAGSFTVDWGDGTTPDTVTGAADALGTITHTYAAEGDYVIAVTVNSGKLSIVGTSRCSQLLKKPNKTDNENIVYNVCVEKIELGSGVNVGSNAFQNCTALASVTIPSSATSIGSGAFNYCYALTSVTIPSSVTSIRRNAFNYCSALASVTIPSSVTSIEDNAFQYCYALASVTIPSSVTSIGSGAFNYCYALTSVTIPSSVTSIGSGAFQNCTVLASVTIPSRVTSIGSDAFSGCTSLASVTIPSSVTSIGNNAFQRCISLASVTIPSRVTSIGSGAFQNCIVLASVTIPSSVTSIGKNAFQSCYGLGFLKFEPSTPPTVSNSSTFSGIPTDCIIYVPTGTLATYKGATNYPDPNRYTYVEY